jgi:hypothetical protein
VELYLHSTARLHGAVLSKAPGIILPMLLLLLLLLLMLTCTVVFVLGCNWPFLAVVKHVNKQIELNLIIICVIIVFFNYDLILSYLNFRTLYSRRRHLDALFLINVLKGKINRHSIMTTVGIRVPTRQIREFSTFSESSALRHSPSARCVIAANEICRFLDIFGKKIVSFEDTFSILEGV